MERKKKIRTIQDLLDWIKEAEDNSCKFLVTRDVKKHLKSIKENQEL